MSFPALLTYRQFVAQSSSMAPSQSLSTPSHIRSFAAGALGRHTPVFPPVHAGTELLHAPIPHVNIPRLSSITPLQSSSWLLHASPLGVTSPPHGLNTPALHVIVPAWHVPTFWVPIGPV